MEKFFFLRGPYPVPGYGPADYNPPSSLPLYGPELLGDDSDDEFGDLDLHLSQTSFMSSSELSETENGKMNEGDEIQEDNSPLKNVDSFVEQFDKDEIKKIDSSDEQSNESEINKSDNFDCSSSSELGKIESLDERLNKSEINKNVNSSVPSEVTKVEFCLDESEFKKNDCSGNSNLPEEFIFEIEVDSHDLSVEKVETQQDEVMKTSGESKEIVDKVSPKKRVAFVDNLEVCHKRMEGSFYLNMACDHLKELIKSKRGDNKKWLTILFKMLKELQNITENKDISGDSKISDNMFSLEETKPKQGRKSATKRKFNYNETPTKATPPKKVAEEKSGKPSERKTIDFRVSGRRSSRGKTRKDEDSEEKSEGKP